MEPLTHALASLALARAGLDRVSPRATPMLLVSGLAADLDWASYFAGPGAYLAWHRTASHSLIGAVAISVFTAIAFCAFRRTASNGAATLRLAPALAICGIGAASHLLLDLADGYGIKLLWPFSQRWFAADFEPTLDPWLIVLLLAALLLPTLFRMVNAEIGARSQPRRLDSGMIAILLLCLLYVGTRSALHQQALAKLSSRRYHAAAPIRAAAFPTSIPFAWRGVVETGRALQQIEIPSIASEAFDPDQARVYFKPPESPILDHARQTTVVQSFLSFARFPLATVESTEDGYTVRVRDLRFGEGFAGEREPEAIVTLDAQSQTTSAGITFAPGRSSTTR